MSTPVDIDEMFSGALPVLVTTKLALRPTPTAPGANTTDVGTLQMGPAKAAPTRPHNTTSVDTR